MTADTLMSLANQIDEVFLLVGLAILLIELAEVLFKGSHKGRTLAEMAVSASTQIPSIAVQVFLLTGAYGIYSVIGSALPWQIPLSIGSLIAVVFLADIVYYWEHRIAHEVRLLWTQHAVHHSSRRPLVPDRAYPAGADWLSGRGDHLRHADGSGLSDLAAYRTDRQTGTVGMAAEHTFASPGAPWIG